MNQFRRRTIFESFSRERQMYENIYNKIFSKKKHAFIVNILYKRKSLSN